MFKNFNEFLTFLTIVIFILFVIRILVSFLFNVNKSTFSLKDKIKYFYMNDDE